MATNGYSIQNAGLHSSNTARVNTGGSRTRIPTVDEALPYSPFSSIVLFNSDIIPIPTTGLRSSASLFANPAERDEARSGLESLNRDITDNPTTQRLQAVLQDLKNLLQPEKVSQFKFKTGPKAATVEVKPYKSKISLSPLAQMVYDSSKVDFTKHRQSENLQARSPKSKNKEVKRRSQNEQACDANSSITVVQPRHLIKVKIPVSPLSTTSQPRAAISSTTEASEKTDEYSTVLKSPIHTPIKNCNLSASSHIFTIVIPARSASQATSAPILPPPHQLYNNDTSIHPSSQPRASLPPSRSNPNLQVRASSQTYNAEELEVASPPPGTPEGIPQKCLTPEGESGMIQTRDERKEADNAFMELRSYFIEISENEDQLLTDSEVSNSLFISTSDGISLSSTAQFKAQQLLAKVIKKQRFSQIPLDDLIRLQKLGDGAIRDAGTADIKVDDAMGESEIEHALQQLSIVDVGIKSARTSLRVMAGGREDRQIYSEDVMQSVVNAFKNVTENCIVPIVEMRSSGASAAVFKLLVPHRKHIISILDVCKKLLSQIAELLKIIDLSEQVITTLEFLASRLIFVENAHTEKDSVLGIAKFDAFRVVAMDVLAKVFSGHPLQRPGIFDEILTSLEKLPVTKQSARHFKLAEGGTIQLVSALIMRLIQTSASNGFDSKQMQRLLDADAMDIDGRTAADGSSKVRITIKSEERAQQQVVTAIQELKDTASTLVDGTKSNASYVVNFIVSRAMNSTKTGDAPYRNLLDLFVDDFITCLKSPEWPAAELLLRLLMYKMVQLAEGDKIPAPAKNMALDLLGSMGAAVSDLRSHTRKTAAPLQNDDVDLSKWLAKLAESSLENATSPIDIMHFDHGPFRTTLAYLQSACAGDPQLQSAVSYFTAEWCSKVVSSFDTLNKEEYNYATTEKHYGVLAYRLRVGIIEDGWIGRYYDFAGVTPAQARLAYSVTLLHSQFCESFSRVFNILVSAMASEQATVRSKSIKSVNQVLETDPTILQRQPAVKHFLLKCVSDNSVQVRDNALGFIGNCIRLEPAFEQEMIPSILARISDTGPGVRKRAIKLANSIYLRSQDRHLRSRIAETLLHRVADQEESVRELARQTIEEIWMSPFYKSTSSENLDTKSKLAMADHVSLMVRTVQRGNGVSSVLDKVLQNILAPTSKLAAVNFKVCKALVASMFETIIDNSAAEDQDAPSAREALEVLTIFAKSDPSLFTPDQVQLLQPYISNVGGNDDLAVLRSVVIIYRHVLPNLSNVYNDFLTKVRNQLLPLVARMQKVILDDITACLWIISSVLEDFTNIRKLVLSILQGIRQLQSVHPAALDADLQKSVKVRKLLLITGLFGKHCNLDSQADHFKSAFPAWNGESVAKLMSNMAAPYTSPSYAIETRSAAFEAIGNICQSWPRNFNNANVHTAFRDVFNNRITPLEYIIMRAFKDFLLAEEKRFEEAGQNGAVGASVGGTAVLGVMGGGLGDGIAIGLAQVFLGDFTRIALASQDEHALLATELIASVARQGSVHPKDCVMPLIILETSQNPKIVDLALRTHRPLHSRHETLLEREYMRVMQQIYDYQRNVVQDMHGATLTPFTSKLCHFMDVLSENSKPSTRIKFFENLCSRIDDFDPSRITLQELCEHLEYSQFIIENMAFFEYKTVDELLSSIAAMEKVVAGAGTGVAHAIELDILGITLDQRTKVDDNGQSQPVQHEINADRLLQLTASSMMLSSLWQARTYLRKQYGLKAHRPDLKVKVESKAKAGAKDLKTRAPTKVPTVTGEKFWEEVTKTMTSLDNHDSQLAQCRAFVDLLSVDQDFKIAAEGDDEADARLTTPSEDENDAPEPPSGGARGHKRKHGAATPGGRKKRARSSSAGPKPRGRPKSSGKQAARGSMDRDSDDE
ncbi:hypothetical protein BJ878DRAFT_440888 [Calycina marina]|uniref:Sister chromatid cohesion protein n=1 Tax=Calycina marina TaxID=1763456 RepID=A0A9P7Z3M5_9HELO|nr:hypothetical protein BJ878DRAFT_440888 [Calycina marina]